MIYLALLLIEIIKVDFWKEWVEKSEDEDETGRNLISLEKIGSQIKLFFNFSDEDKGEGALYINQENSLSIINQWQELCKKRPKEIIITKIREKIILEGKD